MKSCNNIINFHLFRLVFMHFIDIFLSLSLFYSNRWMLRLDKKENYCRRLGMGMVARYRRAKALARSDDSQSDVRNGRNSTRCRPNSHGSCTS